MEKFSDVYLENWGRIPGYEEYEVSTSGKVRKLKKYKTLAGTASKYFYLTNEDNKVVLRLDSHSGAKHFRIDYIQNIVFIKQKFLDKFLGFVEGILHDKEYAGFYEFNEIITYWNYFYNEFDDSYDSFNASEQLYFMWSDIKYTYYFYKKYNYIKLYTNITYRDYVESNPELSPEKLRKIINNLGRKWNKLKFNVIDNFIKHRSKTL